MIEKVFAAVCLVRKGPLLLSVSRRFEPENLGFPGGKCEPGEDPKHTAIRELEEETGLRADPSHVARVFHRYVAPDELALCFEVPVFQGDPTSREEGIEVAWVKPAQLLTSKCTFADFNRNLFLARGIEF